MIPISYNFKRYETPKVGIFEVPCPSGKYDIKGKGWATIESRRTIIGETDLNYIESILPHNEGRWVGNKVVIKNYLLPMGPHKSRLIRWVEGQLSLF